jgi:hypothetical protein
VPRGAGGPHEAGGNVPDSSTAHTRRLGEMPAGVDPDMKPLSIPEVTLRTRLGVVEDGA